MTPRKVKTETEGTKAPRRAKAKAEPGGQELARVETAQEASPSLQDEQREPQPGREFDELAAALDFGTFEEFEAVLDGTGSGDATDTDWNPLLDDIAFERNPAEPAVYEAEPEISEALQDGMRAEAGEAMSVEAIEAELATMAAQREAAEPAAAAAYHDVAAEPAMVLADDEATAESKTWQAPRAPEAESYRSKPPIQTEAPMAAYEAAGMKTTIGSVIEITTDNDKRLAQSAARLREILEVLVGPVPARNGADGRPGAPASGAVFELDRLGHSIGDTASDIEKIIEGLANVLTPTPSHAGSDTSAQRIRVSAVS
jgi:hypothetical protein